MKGDLHEEAIEIILVDFLPKRFYIWRRVCDYFLDEKEICR